MAVSDLEEARARFARYLGSNPPEIETHPRGVGFESEQEDLRTAVFQFGSLEIALFETSDSALAGDCVRALTFHTDDLERAVAYLTDIGATVLFRTTNNEDGDYAILDARGPLSCYLEVLDAGANSKTQPVQNEPEPDS